MSLLGTKLNPVNANDIARRSPELSGRQFQGDHMDVIAAEAIASALQRGWIGRARQYRGDKTVKADDVKVERIIRQAGKERCTAGCICRHHKRVCCRAQSLNRCRGSKHSPIRQFDSCRLWLAARSLLGKSDVNRLIRSSIARVLDLKTVSHFRCEKAQVE